MSTAYPGALGKKSFPAKDLDVDAALHPGTATGTAADARNRTRLLEHQEKGLNLLLAHFKIASDLPVALQYRLLATALAYKHVPYFQLPGKHRGPQPRRGRFALLEVDIAIERRAGAKSDRQALQRLCERKSPWNAKNSDPDSLARQIRTARTADPLARMAHKAIRHGQLTDRVLGAMRRSFSAL